MASKYIAVAEEGTFRTAGTSVIYLKLLNESINTTREDFYPETTQYWVVGKRAEGFFRTRGSFDTLVEPVQWPKLLVLMTGDPSTTGPTDSTYQHVFKFGGNEVVETTGIKPFTTFIGVGIEKDRQIEGCVMESITLEAINKEVVSSTVSIIGSGDESLITAKTPSYTAYAQPYLTFASTSAMGITGSVTGATNRLTTQPTIEAFRMTLTRGWDSDHYVLGNRFLASTTPAGMSTVTGTMDFSFQSEDEYERFLADVGTYAAGDQPPFAINLTLEGALSGASAKYTVQVDIPEAHYTASTVSVKGRDRIVQTVDWMGMYNSVDTCAAKVTVKNLTSSYTSLS